MHFDTLCEQILDVYVLQGGGFHVRVSSHLSAQGQALSLGNGVRLALSQVALVADQQIRLVRRRVSDLWHPLLLHILERSPKIYPKFTKTSDLRIGEWKGEFGTYGKNDSKSVSFRVLESSNAVEVVTSGRVLHFHPDSGALELDAAVGTVHYSRNVRVCSSQNYSQKVTSLCAWVGPSLKWH